MSGRQLEIAGPHPPVRAQDPVAQRQREADGLFGNGLGVGARVVEHDDAEVGGGVDIAVDRRAHFQRGDEPGCRLEQVAIEEEAGEEVEDVHVGQAGRGRLDEADLADGFEFRAQPVCDQAAVVQIADHRPGRGHSHFLLIDLMVDKSRRPLDSWRPPPCVSWIEPEDR